MTAHYRRHRRAWTAVLTVLLSIMLFMTVASAVGLGLARAAAPSASSSAAQPADAARGDSDIFGRRTPESLQPYYYRSLLPLVPNAFYNYYRAILSTTNYLVGVFTFGSILTCVLGGLVVLTRRK